MQKKKKLKILFVSDYFYPHWTGIAKSLYYFIHAVSDIYDVSVLTVQFDKKLKREEELFGAKVIREPFLFTLSRSKYSVQLIFKFLSIAREYDVIFIHSPFSNIFPIALLSKLLGKKLLILHHGDLNLPKGFANRIIEKVFDVASLLSFALADKVSTFTKDYAENSRVLKYYLHKFTPYIIPMDVFTNRAKKDKKRLDIKMKKSNMILFGFAGRFVEEKGFDVLFEAIPYVMKKLPNAHFIYAGDTKISYENFFSLTKDKLEKVQKHITFLGLLEEKELIQFYNVIDFIVLPSRSDCFPLVQLEAMLVGKPSIISDIPGARFPVKETGFGVVAAKEDPLDLADAIVKAAKEKNSILKKHANVIRLLEQKVNVKKIRDFIEQ